MGDNNDPLPSSAYNGFWYRVGFVACLDMPLEAGILTEIGQIRLRAMQLGCVGVGALGLPGIVEVGAG